jgi:hypothetical protein
VKACVDKHSSLLRKGTWKILKSLRMLNAMTLKEMMTDAKQLSNFLKLLETSASSVSSCDIHRERLILVMNDNGTI